MRWGRAVGAAACLATAVAFGTACSSTVEGTPQAVGEVNAAVPDKASTGVPSTAARASGAAPTRSASAGDSRRNASATVRTCPEIESAVAGVVSGATLEQPPESMGLNTQSMCFFVAGGATEPVFAVSLSEFPLPADRIAGMREHMASSGTGGLVESAEATQLGGYLSDPMDNGNIGLTLPGAMVMFVVVGEEPVPQQQVIDVLLAVGDALMA